MIRAFLLPALASAASGPSCESVGVRCLAESGPMKDSTLGLTEVLWVGPENRGVYVGSPSIVQVHGEAEIPGPFLASHDFFGKTTINNTVQVLANYVGDGTQTGWHHVGNVSGMYWANLFVPPKASAGEVYLLGVSEGDHGKARDIVISQSIDNGASWSTPSVIFPAGGNQTYHTAPTPTLVASDGRLYRAFEAYGVAGAMLVSTKQPYGRDTNLLEPTTWQQSSILMFNQSAMVPSSWGTTNFVWEEGGAVEGLDGTIYDILRIDGQTKQAYNKAAVTRLNTSTGELHFERMIDFPACSSKFVIRRSKDTGKYYSLTTDVTPGALALDTIYARNHLVLAVSDDLFSWQVCDTILTDDTGLSPLDSARYTGFHYVDWQFNGQDILFAARTGYRGANSFHNANRMTVQHITNYVGRCNWLASFQEVGYGWCRPTTKYVDAGVQQTASLCASACTSSTHCRSFAYNDDGHCALYPLVANASSGADGVRCFIRLDPQHSFWI